jgi:ribosomal protein S18 acetylase RimI-like enzyme
MKQDFTFERIGLKDIQIIQPLWEELNELHLKDTVYFHEHYQNFTFEKRVSKFQKIKEEDILIEIAKTQGNEVVGYCIATIDDHVGEIDSICITEIHQHSGLGKEFIKDATNWLKKRNCSPIKLAVSYGHESVIEFYKKLGFYPRMTYLELKE